MYQTELFQVDVETLYIKCGPRYTMTAFNIRKGSDDVQSEVPKFTKLGQNVDNFEVRRKRTSNCTDIRPVLSRVAHTH